MSINKLFEMKVSIQKYHLLVYCFLKKKKKEIEKDLDVSKDHCGKSSKEEQHYQGSNFHI